MKRILRIKKSISFILLFAICLSLFSIYSCKHDSSTEPTPITYDITYENGIISCVNSKIIYHGQKFNGSANVPHNKIIGIIKDSVSYLYFTGMGSANLTNETSMQAIGQLFSPPLLVNDQINDMELSTGVFVSGTGNSYNFSNSLYRFIALKNGNDVIYLPPKGGISNELASILSGSVFLIQNDNVNLLINDSVNTYGSSLRALTSSIGALFYDSIINKNKNARLIGADINILTKVNILDMCYAWHTFYTAPQN